MPVLPIVTTLLTVLAAPDASGEASFSASTEDGAAGDASGKLSKRKDRPFMRRWAPERMTAELGIYGGILLPGKNLELFEAALGLPDQGYKRLKGLAPDFGARVGFYPASFLGLELEGGAMPTATKASEDSALLWTARGHVLLQLPRTIAPFLVVGGGVLGVASDRASVGNDVDKELHVGGGVKFYLGRRALIRLDIRDVMSNRRKIPAGVSNSLEVLLGLSIVLGREKDRDKPAAEPVPEPPSDRDGDGFMDPDDSCPDVPGIEPDGCPEPQPDDRDGDGIPDDDDACPDLAGPEPDGCPDRDKDGILDHEDKCPDDPETKNGYEDDDGCPDEVPEAIKQFTGVIEGIYFDTNKDTIKAASLGILDNAVKVLNDFKSIKLKITGHTDSRGNHAHNMDLSRRRAKSVRQYLVDHGVDGSRIETEGFGPDLPIDSNGTKDGRAKNRRIEFEIVQ